MGKISKKKPEKDDSMKSVSQQSNNILTPLRRSTRQSVHMSANKARLLSDSTTPAKTESENKGEFASPRQPMKPKSARKDKVLQPVDHDANLFDETIPELLGTPLKPLEGSAAKKSRGRPKSARKTIEAASVLDISMPAMMRSPLQPVNSSSAVKSVRGRPKSLLKTVTTPQKLEAIVDPVVTEEKVTEITEQTEDPTQNEEPVAGNEPKFAEQSIAGQTAKITGSAKRKSTKIADKLFKIELAFEEDNQMEENVSSEPVTGSTENVLEIIETISSNVEHADEPPAAEPHFAQSGSNEADVDNSEVAQPSTEPEDVVVVEDIKQAQEKEKEDITEPAKESNAAEHRNKIVEDLVLVQSTDTMQAAVPEECKVQQNEHLKEVTEDLDVAEPTETNEAHIKEESTEKTEVVEPDFSELVEAEPENILNTTFDMDTDDQKPAKESLTIDLASPVFQESAEKPKQCEKRINTIDLVTPFTEKRPRIVEGDEAKATPAAKMVIEIMDTPELESIKPQMPDDTSILKKTSGGAKGGRMTRATFVSGCNDSIYIHAEQMQLKSCRKRSQSFCVDDPNKSVRKANRVQFYSPLNMEIDIATIDTRLQQSFVESTAGKRRKRSMSEPFIERPKDGSGNKKVSVRTKVPNFTAIHEQYFKKMESITEHLARKAERTKQILALSKSPVSSTKKPLQIGQSAVTDVPVAHVAPISKSAAPKPKPIVFTTTKSSTEPKAAVPAAKANVTVSKITDLKTVSAVNTTLASRSFAVNRNKTAQRLQSYKRMDGGGNNETSKVKRHAAIKGVRSNRRFELQMQFRDRETQGE